MAPNSAMKKWLAGRKEVMQQEVEAGKDAKGFSELPDGRYVGLFSEHVFEEAKTAGDYRVKSVLTVLEGEQAGEKIWLFEDLQRDDAFKWLTVRLKNCGVEIEDADEISEQILNNPDDLFDLVANQTVVQIVLKTGKPGEDGRSFQNKNVVKVLEDYEIDPAFLPESDAKASAKPKSDPKAKAKATEVADVDDEDEDDDDEGVEVKVGMKIKYKHGDKTLSGTVTKIDDEEDLYTVVGKTGNTRQIDADAIISIIDGETA